MLVPSADGVVLFSSDREESSLAILDSWAARVGEEAVVFPPRDAIRLAGASRSDWWNLSAMGLVDPSGNHGVFYSCRDIRRIRMALTLHRQGFSHARIKQVLGCLPALQL